MSPYDRAASSSLYFLKFKKENARIKIFLQLNPVVTNTLQLNGSTLVKHLQTNYWEIKETYNGAMNDSVILELN